MAIISRPSPSLRDPGDPSIAGGSAVSPTRSKRRSHVIELLVLVLAALLGALGTKTFVAQVFTVPSGSMLDTVVPGERLAVEKVSYLTHGPARGDVIVFDGLGLFDDPTPGAHIFVKRVIGISGDHVVCCDSVGRITVNDDPLDERRYVRAGDVPSTMKFNISVPDGKLWLMGDHRSSSADSRRYIGAPGGGFIPVDRVIGRAMAVVWPLASARSIATRSTFGRAGLGPDS